MSAPVHPGTLEARRERAVQRAITRACQAPSDARMRMVEQLQGAPAEYYVLDAGTVRSAPQDYCVDGVHTPRWDEAVELLRDRYGITEREAVRVLDGTRSGGPWGSS